MKRMEQAQSQSEKQRLDHPVERPGGLNRFYGVLSRVNQIILHAREHKVLFDEVCRIAVDSGKLRLAVVAQADAEGNIVFVSHAGTVDLPIEVPKLHIHGNEQGERGPIAIALTEGRRSIFNDTTKESSLRRLRSLLFYRGVNAASVFPLVVKGKPVAALGLYSDVPNVFNEEEVQLLDEVAARLSFGIDFIAMERERAAAVRALQEKERMLSTLLGNLPGMVYRCRPDENWTMEFVSEGCQELTGYAPASIVLNRIVSYEGLIHPEDSAAIRKRIEETISQGRRFELTYRIRTASGQEKWVHEQGVAIRDAEGQILALEGFINDITEFKKNDLRVRAFSDLGLKLSAATTATEAAEVMVGIASEMFGCDAASVQFYSPATDSMRQAFHMDTEGGVRKRMAPEASSYPPSELGRRVMKEGAQLILKSDPSVPAPGSVPFGNTRRLSASIILAPIRNGAKVLGMVTLHSYKLNAYDKHNMETLQALADHCGGAWERIQTQENLHSVEEQLRHSQKLDAIGQLAGGVAHDFNNLLTVMRGNADLALMGCSGTNQAVQGCLRQIIAAAERASNLTRQLLVFSRKQVIKTEPIVLNDVIANLTSMLTRIIGEHITLECDYDAGKTWIQADSGMMEQILVNLAVNARDAMPRGGLLRIQTRTLTLTAETLGMSSQARPGRYCSMAVRDNGSGISPEILPHIFEPFFTTKAEGKGTGLGLATVYGIVKQHGGWIEVGSEPGQGAVFTIYLPAIEAPAHGSARPQLTKESPVRGGTETILLVEDEAAVRRISKRVLELHGYKILEASSGPNALEIWNANKSEIALLLTDVVMPGGLSGSELAKKLKAEREDLKTIFVSGYSPDLIGRGTEFFRRTGSNFLQKPCPPHQLLEMVRRVLDAKP